MGAMGAVGAVGAMGAIGAVKRTVSQPKSAPMSVSVSSECEYG